MSVADNPFAAPASSSIEYLKPLDADPSASRGARLAAALIDIALFLLIFLPINYLTGGMHHPQEHQSLVETALWQIAGFVVYLLLHGRLLATRGQTIGKYLLKIQIRMLDGSLPSLAHILLMRVLPFWLIMLIPYAGAWISFLDLLLIFRKDRRCFHDVVAGTRVIPMAAGITVEPGPDARDRVDARDRA